MSNEKSESAALSSTMSQRTCFSWPKAGQSKREPLGVYLYIAKKKLEVVAQEMSKDAS